MEVVKKCDAFLAKHHGYISPFVLAIAFVVTMDLVMPTMLLAQEAAPPTDPSPPITQPSISPDQFGIPPSGQMPPQGQGTMGPPPSGQGYPNMGPQGPNMGPQGGMQGQPGMMPGQGPQGPMNGNMGPQNGPEGGQYGPSAADQERALKQMQRGLKGAETGVRSLQKQIDKITKQGIAVPSDMLDAMTKINEILAKAKEAKSIDEAMDSGINDLQEHMQTLMEGRMQLEQLARWPQTVKQADKLLKQLQSMLTADKKIADRLAKKDLDITDIYSKFESSVQALKDSRAKAAELIKTDPEAAFEELQTNFFENIDEVMQNDRTIKELNNLSRFSSSFKSGLASMQSAIKSLKAKKIDASDLESKLQEMKDKAAEITSLMKQKPVDTDAVVTAFEDLNTLREDFENTKHDLIGDEGEVMPWDQGPQQINMKQLNQMDFSKLIPQ